MENAFLATKVSFCNQFYEICQKENINYEELRELFILDKRMGGSHTFVYKDKPYWDSHCLNKDVPHIAYTTNSDLLINVCKFNDKSKLLKGGKFNE